MSAKPREKPAKRPYLSRADRRQQLLAAAASIVEQRGWPALTMISLADEAQVSRQLVYQHFATVNALMVETMRHLFAEHYEEVGRAISDPRLTPAELVRIALQQTSVQSPQRVQALWQIMSASDSENPDLAAVSRKLRRLVLKLWAPVLSRHTGLGEKESGALVWMLNMAIWGAHQLVADGELSRRSAERLVEWTALRVFAPEAG